MAEEGERYRILLKKQKGCRIIERWCLCWISKIKKEILLQTDVQKKSKITDKLIYTTMIIEIVYALILYVLSHSLKEESECKIEVVQQKILPFGN